MKPKFHGGKALARLVSMLEARGYDGLAQSAVANGVADENRAAFDAQLKSYTASPLRHVARQTDGFRTETVERTPADAERSIALDHMAAVQQAGIPSATGPQWRSIGPYTIPNGQTYNGAIRVNVSGRVAAIAVDGSNPAHVLCGAANGGIWESFDRGASWAPRTDYQASTAIGAVTFDPHNAKIAYAGTGEGNWWSWLGTGVLRSSDGGTTWSSICTDPFMGQGFYDLRVDPTSASRLVAATTSGLYVSTDAGVTWTQRRSARTWSIACSASEFLAASSDGLWRSTDSGTTWSAVTLTGAPASFDRFAVSIAPSNTTVAYAWGAKGTTAFLWRRSGAAWSAASSLPPGVSTSQAWYDWYCAAAPDLDNEVYLGAIEAYRGDLSGTAWTWTTTSNHTGGAIHPDQHAIAFEPGTPATIYCGCDGGLFRSPDRGNTWVHCNNGLVISEFEYLVQNPGQTRWILGGTQDNGTDRWSGAAAWDHVADGDGGFVGVNYNDPKTVFHTFFNMSPEASTSHGDWATWSGIAPTTPTGEGSLFYPPLRATESNGSTVAIGGGSLYVSRANGSSWVRIAFPSAATASAVCVPNADNVYVGVTDGRVYHTSWNGTTWTALAALTTPRAGAYVSDLLVGAGDLKRLWVTSTSTGGGRVFRSDDSGTTWTDCSAGLPNLPVTAIEVDSRNASRIWVAMDRGISQSLDAGAHWADFSNGLPNSYVGDLGFHPHAWVLRAATRNRGMWEIPVDGWMTAPAGGVQFTGTIAANQTQTWFTFNRPATWHMVWSVMPTTVGTQEQLRLTVKVERSTEEFVTYFLAVQNLTGVPVTFEGRYSILSRY